MGVNPLVRQHPGSGVSAPARWRDKLAPSRDGQEDLEGEGAFVARVSSCTADMRLRPTDRKQQTWAQLLQGPAPQAGTCR